MVALKTPVRLKVAYNSSQTLLGEYTRTVGKAAAALESAKAVPVGTRFIFEMHAKGLRGAVEVLGEVVSITRAPSGKHLLHIRYHAPADRLGLDRVLERIFDAQRFEAVRKHARIPLHLTAQDDRPNPATYIIRDVSRGGLGVDVEPSMPRHVKLGETFLLELQVRIGTLQLHGEVVWLFTPPGDAAALLFPGFGVRFGKLRPDSIDRLEQLLSLEGLPPPPWRAKVAFGMHAISRMP